MAVLPFDNGSKDSTFDYFAEGLSDDVRSQLTQVQGLHVKARGSVQLAALRAHDDVAGGR